jgi:short-subunit dehydrogenase involved in D-alanine esterification of teichoic acids
VRTNGHLVLVTGGSSGIGLALAGALARAGNQVVIGARDADRLAAAARRVPGAGTVQLDISDVASLPAVLDSVRDRYGPLTMLVNNAGALHRYQLTDPAAGDLITAEITTNILGTVHLTRLALPQLLEQPEAAVVTLSSVLSHVAVPRLPVYAATKAALHSFSRSLRASLAGSSVKVFDVLPPLVDTPMAEQLPGPKIPPAAVAEAVLAGLAADRYEISVGIAKQLARLSRLSPALAGGVLARRLSRGPAVPSGGQPAGAAPR